MDSPFIGQINGFGFNFPPRNWVLCEGQLLAISQFQALFSLLGSMYGGDARTTFAVPDLRGRVPFTFGTANYGTHYNQGQRAGNPVTALTVANLPPHNHSATLDSSSLTADVQLSLDDGTSATPLDHGYLATGVPGDSPHDKPEKIYREDEGSKGTVSLGGVGISGSGAVVIGDTGQGQSFSNMPPYQVINYSIAQLGLYPPRD